MRSLIFVIALAASPAMAGGYSTTDAARVMHSADPAVLTYVVCLSNASGNADRPPYEALKAAEVACQGLAAKIVAKGPDDPVAGDIVDGIAECGFVPDGDPNDDMGCD